MSKHINNKTVAILSAIILIGFFVFGVGVLLIGVVYLFADVAITLIEMRKANKVKEAAILRLSERKW